MSQPSPYHSFLGQVGPDCVNSTSWQTCSLWVSSSAALSTITAPVVKGDFEHGRLAATDRPTPGMRMQR